MNDAVSTVDRSGNLAADSLLRTKFYIPRTRHLQDVLSRPRLVERLKAGVARRLTLISAPAGYGKTVLLSEWIPQSERCVCWLALDEADNEVIRFLTYLIAALQMLKADFGRDALVALEAPQPPDLERLITTLINEITHTLDAFALVLDDYHLIQLQAIHGAVAFLLNHLPPNMHLIITSRADPPLPLARLRVGGQLSEIRAADLRFTADEAATFLNEVKCLGLSPADIAALETRTEGWIAGLQLAALSMQGRHDLTGYIQAFTGSHVYIVDYLAEEVLQRQPGSVQAFMMQTSLLERMSGPLCDTVTGRSGGQETLEQLYQQNLFVIPLDDERSWYRYHHLFAELLRARLGRTQRESEKEIHLRASVWYAQQGLLVEAVHHALAAGAFEQAAQLIEQMWPGLFSLGAMYNTFSNWLATLPVELVRVRPKLCLIHAWLLLHQRDLEAALRRLEEAEQALQQEVGDDLDDVRNSRGEIAATRALIMTVSSHFDADRVSALAQEALVCLRPDNAPYRGVVYGALGTASIHQGDVARAEQAFADAATISRATGNVHVTLASVINQTNLQRARGALGQAIATCQQAIDWVVERGAEATPFVGGVYANLADLLRERNELEAALYYAAKGVERCTQGINLYVTARSYLVLARVKQAQGHLGEAFELVEKVRRLAVQHQIQWISTLLPAIEIQLRLAQGDLPGALSWSPDPDWEKKLLRQFPGSFAFIFAYEYGKITQAQVMLAQGRAAADPDLLREAVAQLEQQNQAAHAAGLPWLQMKTAALQALAHHALGDLTAALSNLERALVRAAPEGYIRLFVDEGTPMAQLLVQAAKAGLLPEYAGRLLAAFDFRPSTAAPVEGFEMNLSSQVATRRPMGGALPEPGMPAGSRPDNLIEPLSERELEILDLIAQGLTNPEIAQRIIVSDQTVKVHTRNIYGKLGVNSRGQAVAKARALGLLA